MKINDLDIAQDIVLHTINFDNLSQSYCTKHLPNNIWGVKICNFFVEDNAFEILPILIIVLNMVTNNLYETS